MLVKDSIRSRRVDEACFIQDSDHSIIFNKFEKIFSTDRREFMEMHPNLMGSYDMYAAEPVSLQAVSALVGALAGTVPCALSCALCTHTELPRTGIKPLCGTLPLLAVLGA